MQGKIRWLSCLLNDQKNLMEYRYAIPQDTCDISSQIRLQVLWANPLKSHILQWGHFSLSARELIYSCCPRQSVMYLRFRFSLSSKYISEKMFVCLLVDLTNHYIQFSLLVVSYWLLKD